MVTSNGMMLLYGVFDELAFWEHFVKLQLRLMVIKKWLEEERAERERDPGWMKESSEMESSK